MRQKTVRRSISMTQEMHDRLALLVSKQPRDTHESDLIREAIRAYLDQQEDIIGSRKHFQKSLQDRVDRLEEALTFHMTVITYLLTALQPDREAKMDDGETAQQLHTHIVLPGTAPLDGVDRAAVYNNKTRGHDALFRDIASRHFEAALDEIVGPEWQLTRETIVTPEQPERSDLGR